MRIPRSTPKGRQPDARAVAEVQALLADSLRDASLLIEFLHRIQDSFRQIGAAHIVALAQELRLSYAEVYEVATFYHHFDVVKEEGAVPAQFAIRVCDGLSCQMAGAEKLINELRVRYQFPIRVLAVPCIGRCDEAPAVCVGQNAFGHATAGKVTAALDAGQVEAQLPAAANAPSPHTYPVLNDCLAGRIQARDAMTTLERAGLRGLGGAGFPTGRKWRIVAAEPGPRLMAVNLDEGEPGTFKDRWYLERDPHAFLEGMLIAAWAVDVTEIYIYLRDEYHAIRALLTREIAALPKH